MTEIDWNHRESLRQWAILASRGHEGARGVAAYHGLTPPAVLPPTPVVRQSPALTPQAPRAVTPTTPTPTPALTSTQRRVDRLTKLIAPPVPRTCFKPASRSVAKSGTSRERSRAGGRIVMGLSACSRSYPSSWAVTSSARAAARDSSHFRGAQYEEAIYGDGERPSV
jgi:hypothetical protein